MTAKTPLPLIVGFGGFNAAGRSSGHLAYKRMIFESLSADDQWTVVKSLAALMGETVIPSDQRALTERVLEGTLVRRIETNHFDVHQVSTGRQVQIHGDETKPIRLSLAVRDLPQPLPFGWTLVAEHGSRCEVDIWRDQSVTLHCGQASPVQAAGQLPRGFNPATLYRSLHHPRGLQLSIVSASDAVYSMGIEWSQIQNRVAPDQIGVYSSSVMSQLDASGFGGMLQARLKGERVTSKQLALGLNTMPADFINAYVLGSTGVTGGVSGACATFLYNLRAAVDDIKSARRRVVLVGSSEAPILPEVIDGYAAMSALATDADLRKLFGDPIDYRRASRPFGVNCGFTLAESGQYVVLMDDTLALELGAQIFAAVPGVYVNADGFKKSISAPGPGNLITMSKAVALAQTLVGEEVLRRRSFVQAHGSSTPQNRVTESRIFDRVAATFGIESWPVAAVKAYVGHSLGPASGDQMMATLGIFAHGIVPGIKTIDEVAPDVHAKHLSLSRTDQQMGVAHCQVGFLNSKGFGGNNATATVLSPDLAEKLLARRHGRNSWRSYQQKLDGSLTRAQTYEAAASRGELNSIYEFGEQLVDEEAIEVTTEQLRLPGCAQPVTLGGADGFEDLI